MTKMNENQSIVIDGYLSCHKPETSSFSISLDNVPNSLVEFVTKYNEQHYLWITYSDKSIFDCPNIKLRTGLTGKCQVVYQHNRFYLVKCVLKEREVDLDGIEILI